MLDGLVDSRFFWEFSFVFEQFRVATRWLLHVQFLALVCPMPKIYVSAITIFFSLGRVTPEILAILALTLLMFRIFANHVNPSLSADHFTVPTHFLDR